MKKLRLTLFFLMAINAAPAGFKASAESAKEVQMAPQGPNCGLEVIYRRTSGWGKNQEVYSVHAEELTVNGEAAYQSVSVYTDRIRRVTMRKSDLTPIAYIEKWSQGDKIIERRYKGDTVYMLRRGVYSPVDTTFQVPRGVHDPESFAFLLRGYPFESQNSISPISVLLAEPNPIFDKPITLRTVIIPKGVEKVKVPAGTFNCYVLEMSLAGVLGYMTPENRFWLLKEDPHLIVKAEGAGETVELMEGPYDCAAEKRCPVKAEAPKFE